MDFLLPAGNWTGGLFGWTYSVNSTGIATHVYWFGVKVPMDAQVFIVMVLPIILLLGGVFLFTYLRDRKERKVKEAK